MIVVEFGRVAGRAVLAGCAVWLGGAGPKAETAAAGHAAPQTAAVQPAARSAARPAARTAPVPLAPQPGGTLDRSARILAAEDLATARGAGEEPLVLVGSAKLSSADRPALFVQLQSPHLCGSAGCSTSVFLWRAGVWSRVLDGVAGKLEVSATRTRGFSDIVAGTLRFKWDGKAYRDTRPAPAVNLTPR